MSMLSMSSDIHRRERNFQVTVECASYCGYKGHVLVVATIDAPVENNPVGLRCGNCNTAGKPIMRFVMKRSNPCITRVTG